MLKYSIVYDGNRRPCLEDMYLEDFMDYLIVKKLIITNWYLLPNNENMLVFVRKEKGED
jgi:hypothetical protein